MRREGARIGRSVQRYLAAFLALVVGVAAITIPMARPTAGAGAPVGVRGEHFVDAAALPTTPALGAPPAPPAASPAGTPAR